MDPNISTADLIMEGGDALFEHKNPCVWVPCLAHRVRKDHYKGMSETERQAVLATQLAQMEERKAKQAAQARELQSTHVNN